MIKVINENRYRVWYRPYGLDLDNEDFMDVNASNEKEARERVSSSGWVSSVEEIKDGQYTDLDYDESKSLRESRKKTLDIPADIAEFVFSRQPDMDGDDYEFENAIDKCSRYTELSDEAYEDQDTLEDELRDIDDRNIKKLAADLGVYRLDNDEDLKYMADQISNSDDLILIMQMNGFKNVERRGNKIYYTYGRNGDEEYIDAPEWR